MNRKIKFIAVFILLCLCLPYLVTVIMSREVREAYSAKIASDDFITVNTPQGVREISFEDYVLGCAARQIEASYQLETLKAQMVVTRTNLCRWMKQHPGEIPEEPYRTLDDIGAEEKETWMLAAESTKGMIMTEDDAPIQASFHKVSAGMTRSGKEVLGSGEYSYLESVESSQDVESEQFLTIDKMRPETIRREVEKAFPGFLEDGKNLDEQLEVISRDSVGYVRQIRVGNSMVSGERFRDVFQLSSSCFTIDRVDVDYRITTKGVGHGLGFSQYGGEKMAEQGAGCEEILQYYFKNIVITERS